MRKINNTPESIFQNRIRSCFITVICAVITVFNAGLFASNNYPESSNPDSSRKFIAAPWVSANSDEGIAVGFTAGISKFPNLLLYSSLQTSTEGYSSLTLRGEMGNDRVRNIINAAASNAIRYSYDPYTSRPEPIAKALVNRYQVRYSRLFLMDDLLEIGPDILFDYSYGNRIEYIDGDGIELNTIPGNVYVPRFAEGGSLTLGLRARYRTTNANRPLNGYMIDFAFRLGDGGFNKYDSRNGELRIAFARPVTNASRIYVRFLSQYQGSAEPPVQNHLGGENTLRGEPSQRDFGPGIICARMQYHLTVLDNWAFPFHLANRIWSIFPLWKMEVEGVCFYDIGSAESYNWGRRTGKWYKTRQGYGAGLRFVIPPELVLFFDVARSPHGSPRFYIGVGETL